MIEEWMLVDNAVDNARHEADWQRTNALAWRVYLESLDRALDLQFATAEELGGYDR